MQKHSNLNPLNKSQARNHQNYCYIIMMVIVTKEKVFQMPFSQFSVSFKVQLNLWYNGYSQENKCV